MNTNKTVGNVTFLNFPTEDEREFVDMILENDFEYCDESSIKELGNVTFISHDVYDNNGNVILVISAADIAQIAADKAEQEALEVWIMEDFYAGFGEEDEDLSF